MDLMQLDIMSNTAMEISTALYDHAWDGNTPYGMTDFPSACVFSYTGDTIGDFAMHPVDEETLETSQSIVSDFPAYCPITSKDISEPGTTTSPWHDDLLENVPDGYFGTAMKAYGRARAQIETMNHSSRGYDAFFKRMWGLPPELNLAPLVCTPRTTKATIWAQGGKHLSPAAHGVIPTTPVLRLEQGVVSRRGLSQRAGREVYADWPRLRSIYTIMANTCQIEDKLVRSCNTVLRHKIVARELPPLRVPKPTPIKFPDLPPTTTRSNFTILAERYLEVAKVLTNATVKPTTIENVEIEEDLFVDTAMLRQLSVSKIPLKAPMISKAQVPPSERSATYDLCVAYKQDISVNMTGNRRGLKSIPSIRDVLKTLMYKNYRSGLAPMQIRRLEYGFRDHNLNDEDLQTVRTLVMDNFHDSILAEVIFYLKILGVDSESIYTKFQRLMSPVMTCGSLLEHIDIRAWAKHYRTTDSGCCFIMGLISEVAAAEFAAHICPLAGGMPLEHRAVGHTTLHHRIARLITVRKNFWAHRYSRKAQVMFKDAIAKHECQHLTDLPNGVAVKILNIQMRSKVMRNVKFKVSKEGDVTTSEDSMKQAFLNSHVKFCEHRSLEPSENLQELLALTEDFNEWLITIDGDRELVCEKAKIQYVKISSVSMWRDAQESVQNLQNDLTDLLGNMKATSEDSFGEDAMAQSIPFSEELETFTATEHLLVCTVPAQRPPPEPILAESTFEMDSCVPYEENPEISTEEIIDYNIPDLASKHIRELKAMFPKTIKITELSEFVKNFRKVALDMVKCEPPKLETPDFDLYHEK